MSDAYNSFPWKRKSPERADPVLVFAFRRAGRPDARAGPSREPGSRSRDRLTRTGVEIVRLERERGKQGDEEKKKERKRERQKSGVLTLFLDPAAPTEADAERGVLSPRASLADSRDVIRDGTHRRSETRVAAAARGGPRASLSRVSLSFHGFASPLSRRARARRFTQSTLVYFMFARTRRTRRRAADASAKWNGTERDALDDETAAAAGCLCLAFTGGDTGMQTDRF